MTAWDYSALTAPVTRAEVRQFRRSTPPPGPSAPKVDRVTVYAATFAGILVLGAISLILYFERPSLPESVQGPVSVALPVLAPVAVVVGILALAVYVYSRWNGNWSRRLRLTRFARANGLHFSPGDRDPGYQGSIFGVGRSRAALDHFMTRRGRPLDFGNYRYSTGRSDDRTRRTFGFVAIGLDRALPHMLLDARANSTQRGRNMTVTFNRDQVLSLEGDFDEYFTLYCPREYERDALYVFTPDLMALLIDEASAFDVEIVDDWMFVYSTKKFQMDDPATIQRILRVVDTVAAKTISRTGRYSDDRQGPRESIGPNTYLPSAPSTGTIAPAGRRLRREVPATLAVIVGVFAAFLAVRLLLPF